VGFYQVCLHKKILVAKWKNKAIATDGSRNTGSVVSLPSVRSKSVESGVVLSNEQDSTFLSLPTRRLVRQRTRCCRASASSSSSVSSGTPEHRSLILGYHIP